MWCTQVQGLREGGSGGTSYPGPGSGGPGRVEVVATSFNQNFFLCLALYLSLSFGQKIRPNLSEDLFFFALHLILGKKSDQIWAKTFSKWSVSSSFNFGGPASISVPPEKLSLWRPAQVLGICGVFEDVLGLADAFWSPWTGSQKVFKNILPSARG